MEKDLRSVKNLLSFIVGVMIIYFISLLSSLLIPLALALFAAILLQPIMAWFEKRNWPLWLSLVIITLGTIVFLGLISAVVYGTYKEILNEKEAILGDINQKLSGVLSSVNQLSGSYFNDFNAQESFSLDWVLKSTGNFAGTFAGMLGDFTSVALLTILYFVGLIGGILHYEQYLHYLEPEEGEGNKLVNGFEQVKNSIVSYMKIKFFISLLTGISYMIICYIFGLRFAVFWGFLAFILNFIPSIGSLIATIPPLLLGLIELDGLGSLFLLFILMMVAQNFMGNYLEPRITGESLSLNFITVIFGLVFWGYLWGITGMILSVPLMVLIKVILSQFPAATILVRLMGSKPDSLET